MSDPPWSRRFPCQAGFWNNSPHQRPTIPSLMICLFETKVPPNPPILILTCFPVFFSWKCSYKSTVYPHFWTNPSLMILMIFADMFQQSIPLAADSRPSTSGERRQDVGTTVLFWGRTWKNIWLWVIMGVAMDPPNLQLFVHSSCIFPPFPPFFDSLDPTYLWRPASTDQVCNSFSS